MTEADDRAVTPAELHAFDSVDEVLDVQVERGGGLVRLVVHGDLDLASGEQLRSVAEPVLAQEPPRLVVDLQRLALLDASGIAVLDHLDALARRVDVPFAIAVLRNHPARRTLADAGALARLPTC